jgi:hypothetical protein
MVSTPNSPAAAPCGLFSSVFIEKPGDCSVAQVNENAHYVHGYASGSNADLPLLVKFIFVLYLIT